MLMLSIPDFHTLLFSTFTSTYGRPPLLVLFYYRGGTRPSCRHLLFPFSARHDIVIMLGNQDMLLLMMVILDITAAAGDHELTRHFIMLINLPLRQFICLHNLAKPKQSPMRAYVTMD